MIIRFTEAGEADTVDGQIPTLSSLANLGSGGPLSAMPEALAEQVRMLAEAIRLEPGETLVEQLHKGTHFFLLLHGRIDFHITLGAASESLLVGTADKPWTPVGWSAFREPGRYASKVTAVRASSFLRFAVTDLQDLFSRSPETGFHFFQVIAGASEHLLVEAREKLVNNLRASTTLSHWGSAFDRARAITRRQRPRQKRVTPLPPSDEQQLPQGIPSQESMVTNAAPEVSEVFQHARFFQGFPEAFLIELMRYADVHYFCRGEVLAQQGDYAEQLLILADGQVRLEYASSSMRTIVLRMTRDPGSMLSLSAVSGQLHHGVTVRATRDGSVVRIPEEVLKNLCTSHPEWGCLLGQRVLGAMSRELRSARAHLVSEAFDGELLAVENILEQIRTELPVSSKLHKIPHLLKAAVTMADALTIIDQARASEDQLASHTANLCHELLAPVRRENRFFSGLAAAYEEVVRAPISESPASLRKKCAANFVRVFSEVPSEVRGLENLPSNSGNIFLFNHLKNHEHNTLPNGFQLTLDSHFISSMILHKKYGDPGVRVVRQSRASEYGHQAYYERLGHISVYTPDSDTPSDDRSDRFVAFLEAASAHLARGQNLVLAPEGTSYPTEKSPGPFKAGAFRLAGALSPEPYLVPIAMANFDRRLAHARLAVVVHPPFRMSEYVSDVNDPAQLGEFLESFRAKYAGWVKEASAIAELG